ncbi:translocation/assembly module TamB domain-containing protein [Sulfurimonas sp.]|uniref:translocation/assembly module TamB domain-containing protein n=1 Tax=Sulfurimonas sp. TaxID=2022749 RepID=UPI0025EA6E2D|nr:translocation/assembly module TamB domain-containing protein [Sulfurimonas sp.]MCK9472837.1 translocation/assembly module TamB [Sulfurimonas sp.]MDD3505351.1 translocation/assembly module TamB domain-containing protein [Sulfurimonas sp.]
MIKKAYTFLHFTTLFALFITAVLLFVLFQKDVVPYLAQKYLKEYDVEYKYVEGTLFSGVVLKGVKYKNSVEIEELKVEYNLLMLIKPTPRLKRLRASGVYIDADKLLKLSGDDASSSTFALNISKLNIDRAKIEYKKEIYSLNLNASDVSIRDKIDIQKIALQAKTPYAHISLEGNVKANIARGKSTVVVDAKMQSKYLDFLIYTPSELEVIFDITTKKADLKTSIKNITFKDIKLLTLNNLNLNMIYSFDDDFFTLLSSHTLSYEGSEVSLKQESLITLDGKIESKIEAEILKDEIGLPFESFAVKIKRDDTATEALFSAKDIDLNLQTKDFQTFLLKAKTLYADLDAKLKIEGDASTLRGELYLKSDAPYLKEYKIERFSKLNLFVSKNKEEIKADISADIFSLTLLRDEKGVTGVAKVGSSKFDIKANLEKKYLKVESKIESLKKVFSELKISIPNESFFFDASAKIKAEISYEKRLQVDARVDIPWYRLELDSKNIYTGKDAFFEFLYADKELWVKRYFFKAMGHEIYSNKISRIGISENGDMELKEFWIYDNLPVKGALKTSDMSADVSIKSDRFTYVCEDANISAKMDLQVKIQGSDMQSVDGDIELLEGVVKYAPKKEYAIGDEDIIIIQDMKDDEKKALNRSLNIRISSLKPIRYKIKEVDVLFTPNLILYKEPDALMQLLGTLHIHSGSVTISEREFEFDESEIYFYDEKFTNPYLNLNLHYYTLNNIDIEIYITNRVNSPIIILSSNPYLSQDDIISYILFGSNTSSAFDTTDKGSKTQLSTLALGAGLKELFNKSTSLKIDTLNILTNEDGTLGYEIGKRFSKNIRVVYKNDAISTIILQYSLSKSIRVDVDIKETGQGVGIFYIKDFKLKE